LEKKNAYRILVANPDRKRPPGIPRRMWVDNFKIDLKVIGWGGMDWISLDEDSDRGGALLNMVVNLRVP
jgi:hypothetical protein